MAACTPPAEELFADGKAAFAKYDYRTARIQLAEGLKQEPGNAEMLELLATVLVKLGNGEGAAVRIEAMEPDLQRQEHIRILMGEANVLRERFDAALEEVAGIETSAADRVKALAHIGKGEFAEALTSFEAGMTRPDPDPLFIASYARFEFERGRWNEADRLVTMALKAAPSSIEAQLVKADLFERRNQLPDSLAQFEETLALQETNFDASLGRARVLTKMGRGDEALAIAEALQASNPKSAPVAAVRASVAANRGAWSEVRTRLQPFETDLPALSEAAVLYAEALVELDLPGQAVAFLAPQFNRQPNWRDLRVLYARALSESADHKAAMAVLEPLVTRPDAEPAELQLAARIAGALGDPRTDQFASRATSPAPEWVGGALAKADRALRNRQWGEAEEAYLALIEQFGPTNALSLNNLAYAQGRLGKTQEALGHALQAVRLAPENASILDTAGVLLAQAGERERAIALLEKAVQLDPSNASVRRNIAELRGG
jgi:tetratricopeptide (TPR) repeat protein